ncbi:hypothetical protein WR25_20527 isoform A [Diploscapter pachys]|uniref:ZP domain-containing protein n=1 Tax=Diploscapter pachys TaxID=2018661 RepID=A0A2A2KCB4_9BILA|nr:hypothetical protein WR25_20527 isoform A [Diploscapter pachys]
MTNANSVNGNEYSDLMRKAIGVRIEEIGLSWHGNRTTMAGGRKTRPPRCTLTLHKSGWNRDTCAKPRLMSTDKILWSTRICYKWQCETTEYAMLVHNCYIGSARNPLYIIREDGCTTEGAIMSSPSYNSFTRAVAIGYLSVRELGMQHVTIKCNVRLCHLCDEDCREITPPRSCSDYEKERDMDYDRMWNASSRVQSLCRPAPSSVPSSNHSFNLISIFSILLYCMISLLLHVNMSP